jgi:hypothetical protein
MAGGFDPTGGMGGSLDPMSGFGGDPTGGVFGGIDPSTQASLAMQGPQGLTQPPITDQPSAPTAGAPQAAPAQAPAPPPQLDKGEALFRGMNAHPEWGFNNQMAQGPSATPGPSEPTMPQDHTAPWAWSGQSFPDAVAARGLGLSTLAGGTMVPGTPSGLPIQPQEAPQYGPPPPTQPIPPNWPLRGGTIPQTFPFSSPNSSSPPALTPDDLKGEQYAANALGGIPDVTPQEEGYKGLDPPTNLGGQKGPSIELPELNQPSIELPELNQTPADVTGSRYDAGPGSQFPEMIGKPSIEIPQDQPATGTTPPTATASQGSMLPPTTAGNVPIPQPDPRTSTATPQTTAQPGTAGGGGTTSQVTPPGTSAPAGAGPQSPLEQLVSGFMHMLFGQGMGPLQQLIARFLGLNPRQLFPQFFGGNFNRPVVPGYFPPGTVGGKAVPGQSALPQSLQTPPAGPPRSPAPQPPQAPRLALPPPTRYTDTPRGSKPVVDPDDAILGTATGIRAPGSLPGQGYTADRPDQPPPWYHAEGGAQGGTGPGAGGDGYTRATIQIESGGRTGPGNRTGSNVGLAQFGPEEERRYGLNAGNRDNPQAVGRALQMERDENRPALVRALGREPTDAEYYIAHQQGKAGAAALFAAERQNPNAPAWQAVRRFYHSDAIARRAIGGNVPGVNPVRAMNLTAGQFLGWWRSRFDRELARIGGTAVGF